MKKELRFIATVLTVMMIFVFTFSGCKKNNSEEQGEQSKSPSQTTQAKSSSGTSTAKASTAKASTTASLSDQTKASPKKTGDENSSNDTRYVENEESGPEKEGESSKEGELGKEG